ncbi:hypothetical protein NW752_001807 [Fusarium irregulare]|uniref:F-box domain-containing protein n=1 Tax=Fusarium irregulare TaxID=2494466 RepID=A0A9W8PV94_9HYPO|nr:hypothetical protein NW766_003971 [Fusarium irregulare]KAJ4026849.1 hypothetical protein NW752_001807 [Fusarium irregulare]
MAASPAETRVYLFHLPAELYQKIVSYLKKDSVKHLRVTCWTLNKITPFIIDRVFISANSLNIQVFRAIADSKTFRHNVTEIIWDDARLSNGPEDAVEEDRFWTIRNASTVVTDNGCPVWFKARRQDTDAPEFRGWRDPSSYNNLSVEASWDYYKSLLEDQRQILLSGADIEAFKHGLRRFPNLKRVTVTPSTHGKLGQPMYQTPMIRAFPPRFDYPLPKQWPNGAEEEARDALPWIQKKSGGLVFETFYGQVYQTTQREYRARVYECTPEEYRARWRGFRVVLRTLVENSHEHNVTELTFGGAEIVTGMNCRLFDQPCREYADLVTVLKRPGFRRLALDLFTGMNEYHNWKSFRSGLMHKALSKAKDLRHITLHSTTYTINGETFNTPGVDGLPNYWPVPLQSVFPINCWPKLEHFGISNIQVTPEDLLSFLAALPYSCRSVELSNLAWANEDGGWAKEDGGYHFLLNEMLTRLDWCSRPVGERPRLKILVTLVSEIIEDGLYVDMGNLANAFLYDDGENPFLGPGFFSGGGVGKSFFDPEVSFFSERNCRV